MCPGINYHSETNVARVRRIKCGEQRPECTNCQKSGWKCSYGENVINYGVGSSGYRVLLAAQPELHASITAGRLCGSEQILLPTDGETEICNGSSLNRGQTSLRNTVIRNVLIDETEDCSVNELRKRHHLKAMTGMSFTWHDGSMQVLNRPLLQKALTMFPERTPLEVETFHRFRQRLAPRLGQNQDQGFWHEIILPMAHQHIQVFDAALATTTLYELPLQATLSQSNTVFSARTSNRYHNAVTWYTQSIRNSMHDTNAQTPPGIALLLATSILYLMIELRQGHPKNTQSLCQTAFAIIHGFQDLLIASMDRTVLRLIVLLLYLSVTLSINTTEIAIVHRRSAIALAIGLCAIYDEPTCELQIRLVDSIHSVNDLLTARRHDVENVTIQMEQWHRLYTLQSSKTSDHDTLTSLGRLHQMHTGTLVQLRLYNARTLRDELKIQSMLSQFLTAFEMLADGVEATKQKSPETLTFEYPFYLLEITLLPVCLFVVWNWRDERVLGRIEKLLQPFISRQQNSPALKAMAHFKDLVGVGRTGVTSIEKEVFKEKPSHLMMWHSHAILQRLLREA